MPYYTLYKIKYYDHIMKEKVDKFPKGDACPNCGSKLTIHFNLPNYKSASCSKCGWYGWSE